MFNAPIDKVTSPVISVTSAARNTDSVGMTFSSGKCRYSMTRSQDISWIHKSKCVFSFHRWETNGIQSEVSPSDILKPPNPQKFETSRLIIYHVLPSVNHVRMVYP